MTLFAEINNRFNAVESLINKRNEIKTTAADCAMDYVFDPNNKEAKAKADSMVFVLDINATEIRVAVERLANYLGYCITGTQGELDAYIRVYKTIKAAFKANYTAMFKQAETTNKHLRQSALADYNKTI